MEWTPRIKRSKSLKSALSVRRRRDSVLDAEETLPPSRPSKPTLIRLHVTTDDIDLKSKASIPPTPLSTLRVPSDRNTWPQTARERKPGSYAFDEIPTLTKTPWEQNRALRSGPRRSRSTTCSSASSHDFVQLPREILHCILDNLRASSTVGSTLNAASYRSDLRALCITNKQWHRVAREHLYREIRLSTSRLETSNSSARAIRQLKLLLRTLQESPGLAHLVKRLHLGPGMVREIDAGVFMGAGSRRKPLRGSTLPALCEVVTSCPNLQALSGHYPLAFDETAELLEALRSRTKLREHVWNLSYSLLNWRTLQTPGAFVDHHAKWRELQTLVLWGDAACSDCLGPGAVTALLQHLPQLRHLTLKALPRTEFHNGTLLMLPALRSLRLEGTPGITDHGLQQLIHSRLAMSLESFSVIGLELTSLRTIQALLENLPRLRRFRLIQETSPELHEVFSFTGTAFSFGSATLEYLHWNTLLPSNATAILANAIAAGKLPKLRSIKIPSDHDGAVQKLCRPIQQRTLAGDEIREHIEDVKTESLAYRTTTTFLEMEAQLRAKRAKKDSDFSVTVEDEEGVRQFQWAGSYLGSITSKVEYLIEPDVEREHYSYATVESLSRPARPEEGFELDVGLEVLF